MSIVLWVSTESTKGTCWLFCARAKNDVRESVSDPMSTITAVLLGFQWSALLLSIVIRDAMRGVFSVSPELRSQKLYELLKEGTEQGAFGAFGH